MNLDQNWFLETISGKRTSIVASTTRLLLSPLAIVYRLVIVVRNWAYDHGLKRIHWSGVPVISVGNLTTGGTGKTPFVIWLANRLSEDFQVTVISRGYGAAEGELNDEGREIAAFCPAIDQLQNPDRVAAARRLDQLTNSLIILDDGFQHRRIGRELDIVLIDALNPFGYGRLIPRGLLREPVASIGRGDLVLLTRSNLVSAETRQQIRNTVQRHGRGVPWAEAQLRLDGWRDLAGSDHQLELLNNSDLFAFCAIGNPAAFHQTLRQQNWKVVGSCFYKDHHEFNPNDLRNIEVAAKASGANAIVCTMKDWVKIPKTWRPGLPVYALTTTIEIGVGADLLEQQLEKVLAELKNARRNKPAKPLTHR